MNLRVRLLAALGGAIWLLYASLALRDVGALYAMPIAEDGWYALTVARNMARGLGITIDGAVWTNGFQPLFTFLQAAAFALAGGNEATGLRFFFVLAAQCMSTIAVVKRESGSWRWAGLMVAYMSALAYVASLLVYQVGLLLGFGA